MTPQQVRELERYLTPAEREELDALIAADLSEHRWRPLPGPQTMAYESEADVIGFGGAAGGGKGLALTTPIATPFGWTTMGALQVGDTVFDEAGNPCTVTAVSEVNNRPCYRLTFDDGSTLIADDVHRWVTFDAKELSALTRRDPEWRAARRAKRASRAKPTTSPARLAALAERNARCVEPLPPPTGTMRDTRTLAATLMAGKRRNHAIRVAGALNLPDVELPVPPYTLGAWLGDGSSLNGQFTGKDAYVWERIESEGYEVRHYAWNEQAHSIIGLKAALRDLGVLENKHIPLIYLRAGYAQRLALLQGLMDTDGHAALDGGCEFDTMNEALAVGVRQLAATLGIKSTLQRGAAKLNGRVVGPKWRVKFTTSVPVFGMPRKAERLKRVTRRTSTFRYLVACDPIESVPTRCIAVDSPSRQYLAGEQLIPTHNTDLALGLALTQHYRTQVFRREGPQLKGIIDRLAEILGSREQITGNPPVYRGDDDRQIEFNSMPNLGDETKYQGRPKDLLVIDEAANFLEQQVRFVKGWVRTTRPGQRTRTLLTFNPPTTAEGRWVIDFFAPWLDKKHPLYPSAPGQLRYVYVDPITGEDVWVLDDDPRPFVFVGNERCYDFDPREHRPEDIVRPESRTFIPSRVTDNPFLVSTGYMAQLQALPEPLRSQMLLGDFQAGIEDDPWQVIPTRWVEIAQERWRERARKGELMSMGVDVARGGKDNTVIATRYKNDDTELWFDRLKLYPGSETPNGRKVAGLVIGEHRDHAPIHLDVVGVGASPYDVLSDAGQPVYGVNVSEKATARDKSGRLTFFNLRSQLWWQMREALDPEANNGIALPPDPDLLKELCAPRWELSGMTIKVESREEIIKRVGRSPDRASALVLALMDTPKVHQLRYIEREDAPDNPLEWDPYSRL
jgi:hypothetical protein